MCTSGRLTENHCSRVYSANSLCSSRISRAGPKRASCRHSSAPIDPPAPETSTVRPASMPLTLAVSISTVSRPSRSSISTGRIDVTATRPDSRSSTPGTVKTWAPAWIARSVARRRTSVEADGIARMAWRAFSLASTCGSDSIAPNTGRPSTSRPHLAGSSSTSPTTRQSGTRSSSRTSIAPPRPAPTITTGLPSALSPPYSRCSLNIR